MLVLLSRIQSSAPVAVVRILKKYYIKNDYFTINHRCLNGPYPIFEILYLTNEATVIPSTVVSII